MAYNGALRVEDVDPSIGILRKPEHIAEHEFARAVKNADRDILDELGI